MKYNIFLYVSMYVCLQKMSPSRSMVRGYDILSQWEVFSSLLADFERLVLSNEKKTEFESPDFTFEFLSDSFYVHIQTASNFAIIFKKQNTQYFKITNKCINLFLNVSVILSLVKVMNLSEISYRILSDDCICIYSFLFYFYPQFSNL